MSLLHDDFNGGQLNDAHWTATNVSGFSALHGFFATQEFRSENTLIQDNCLHLRSCNELDSHQRRPNQLGSGYETGRVDTRGKFAFTYGEVEVRARLPKGAMIRHFPAVWLLDSEADFKEARGWELGEISSNRGYPAISVLNAREDTSSQEAFYTTDIKVKTKSDGMYDQFDEEAYWNVLTTIPHLPDMSRDFHTYQLLWEPERLVSMIDGIEIHRVTDPEVIPSNRMQV